MTLLKEQAFFRGSEPESDAESEVSNPDGSANRGRLKKSQIGKKCELLLE